MSKSKQKRDYRTEYQRRIERGLAKGLSRSQARGHPSAREKYTRKPKSIDDHALQISLQALRSGKTLTQAAREIRVSPERLRNQAKAKGAIRKKGQRWEVIPKLPRKMPMYSKGKSLPIIVGSLAQASKVGRYMAAVSRFMRTNDPASLKPFIGKVVTDKQGKKHPFETTPNTLYRLAASSTETFEQVYRIII